MKTILTSLRLLTLLTLITGLAYPVVVTLIAQALFPSQANGSLIRQGGRVIGSELLAQKFASSRYFHPRPSASDHATVPGGASNLSPASAALAKQVVEREVAYRALNTTDAAVPDDALTASASGLDPHISVANARLQAVRVAKVRALPVESVLGLIQDDPVNVLRLNIVLDSVK